MQKFTPAAKAEQRIANNVSENPTAPGKEEIAQNAFVKMVQDFESQIALALPRHLTPGRMTRTIITEVRKNKKLAECDRASFLGSIITAAQLGLEPGAGLGHVYLVPYWNSTKGHYECQMIIGYQGMIDLAERDERVTISAGVIYEKDTIIQLERGSDEAFKMKPYFGKEDRGEIIGAYAVAKYKDGRSKFEILNMNDIEYAMSFSKSKDKKGNPIGPWRDHFAAMAKKTAIRVLFKMVPKSPEMARAVEVEEIVELKQSNSFGELYKDFQKDKGLPEIEGSQDSLPAIESAVESGEQQPKQE